ncbi:hypothetical protein [Nocardioides sp. P86]|uniref:hypothetical protein n=1 Tax=Nocardioides sp. P86 TaxID=2939569 RepID=UPI0020405FEA|nr:hypothetical protein [Nocardioides sp. P86]MCM3514879.1 hypothetical protein [Nocardioides sp. P86]
MPAPWTHALADTVVSDPALPPSYDERLGSLPGAALVADTDLPRLALPQEGRLAVAVAVTGGAGQLAGPAGWCARRPQVRLTRLAVTLRDLDDLAGNARRVVAAVDAARGEGALADDVVVQVGVPAGDLGPTGPTAAWLAALDELAAAELGLLLPAATEPGLLVALVDAALDRETPWHAGGCGAAPVPAPGPLALLAATRLAFDGASRGEVVEALTTADAAALLGLDGLAGARRWLTGADLASPAEVEALGAALRDLGVAL